MTPDEVRERLRNARGFIFDMDGTLVLGDRVNHGLRPLPGAAEMLDWVRGRGLPYIVFTNGTNRAPAHFAGVLREAGLAVPDEAMMTPASSAVVMFTKRGYKRVMVLGGDGLAQPQRDAGIDAVPPAEEEAAGVDAVLAGWYPEFTMPALEAACHAVWAGAALFSASQTPFFASANGRALAIAVDTGLGDAAAYDHLPAERQPHLRLRGVDELLSICRTFDASDSSTNSGVLP